MEIRDFLNTRLEDARRSVNPLRKRASELRAELADVDNKIRALAREIDEAERALQAIGKTEKLEPTITIKEAVLAVLADAPEGLTSPELLASMNDRFFEGTLVRTSMSPQLTRLKREEKVIARGERYFLA